MFSEASRLRLGVPCSLADGNSRHGGSHTVFNLVFEDSVRWAARVSHDSNNWKNELRAIKTFQHIKQQCPEIKAPNVFFEANTPSCIQNGSMASR